MTYYVARSKQDHSLFVNQTGLGDFKSATLYVFTMEGLVERFVRELPETIELVELVLHPVTVATFNALN